MQSLSSVDIPEDSRISSLTGASPSSSKEKIASRPRRAEPEARTGSIERRKFHWGAVISVSGMALACPGCAQPTSALPPGIEPGVEITQRFIIGADISWVQAAEDRGVRFSDNGVEKDILEILKNHGFNAIRLRVFHDPTKPTPRDRPYSRQGFCDLPHTIDMAKRVKAAGMGLLINFHYSDSWADPGKQFTPSAWAELSFEELTAVMREWTRDAIANLKDAGARPDMVQIGNEITPGLMTDRGGSVCDWRKLGRLLKAGIAGVKDADARILILLHLDKGGDNMATRRWVDAALAEEVPFDVLGLSCYPRWHGPPSAWKANFDDLAARYPGLSFLIVELSAEILETNRIMHELPGRKGLGTFIWEPTANNNGQALFDRQGAVIPERMRLYDEAAKRYGKRSTGR